MNGLRVFIAGAIQGDQTGGLVAQDYRTRIAGIVRGTFPGASVHDPAASTTRALAQIGQDTMTERVDAFATASSEHPVSPVHDLDGFGAVAAEFLAETATAAECSLCIAYLPGSGLSMGTAMEMYAAKAAGVPVVTVTGNVRNLAVLSTSDLVISDLGQLPQALETIRSDRGIAQ